MNVAIGFDKSYEKTDVQCARAIVANKLRVWKMRCLRASFDHTVLDILRADGVERFQLRARTSKGLAKAFSAEVGKRVCLLLRQVSQRAKLYSYYHFLS